MKKHLDMLPYLLIVVMLTSSVVYLVTACKASQEETFRVVESMPECDEGHEYVAPCDTDLPGGEDCEDGIMFCHEDCASGQTKCDKCQPAVPELCPTYHK